MKKIAVLNSNESINQKILSLCNELGSEFEPVFLKTKEKCLEYLSYELPEINVYNFTDEKIDMYSILDNVKSDPWLHYGGIIAVCDNESEEKLLREEKNINIISIIQKTRFDFSFPRTIRIVKQNRQIVFQRHIENQFLNNIIGHFEIDNDPFDVVTYAHLVSNYLFNSNYINQESKEGLHVALQELLMNAIEHGNCKISFKEKSKWLNSGKDIFELIRIKNKDSNINSKKVFFTYKIARENSTFTIRDEGEGFDWKKIRASIKKSNPTDELHGKGLLISEIYVSKLRYNKKGNEVNFELPHRTFESNIRPKVFSEQEEVIFNNDDIIFHEGEESNFLYYIVSGKLKIITNNKVIAYLSPTDIFLGEMSFLLNDRRSATVKSDGKSVLLKISKEGFFDTLKRNPHYAVFLARLLAQRINRLNQQKSGGKS